MKIEFKVEHNSRKMARIFCQDVIRDLQRRICTEYNYYKMKIRVDSLVDAEWMRWKTKPRSLSVRNVMKIISNNFIYNNYGTSYIIYQNPRKLFPNSETPIYRVLRFLDYGNESIRGTYFVSTLMRYYQNNIYKLFYTFQLKLIVRNKITNTSKNNKRKGVKRR